MVIVRSSSLLSQRSLRGRRGPVVAVLSSWRGCVFVAVLSSWRGCVFVVYISSEFLPRDTHTRIPNAYPEEGIHHSRWRRLSSSYSDLSANVKEKNDSENGCVFPPSCIATVLSCTQSPLHSFLHQRSFPACSCVTEENSSRSIIINSFATIIKSPQDQHHLQLVFSPESASTGGDLIFTGGDRLPAVLPGSLPASSSRRISVSQHRLTITLSPAIFHPTTSPSPSQCESHHRRPPSCPPQPLWTRCWVSS